MGSRARLTACRRRDGDGWTPLAAERALDEVAEKLGDIVARHGPEAVAIYTGCGGHRTSASGPWFVQRFLRALGSSRMYTSFTIDSPSLSVAGNRFFGAPVPCNLLDVERAECAMFVGTNPGRSHQLNMAQSSPSHRIQQAKRGGMKIIVLDPRVSDQTEGADLRWPVARESRTNSSGCAVTWRGGQCRTSGCLSMVMAWWCTNSSARSVTGERRPK